MRTPEPDKTTLVSLAWMIGVGVMFLLMLLALALRKGLDALGKSPVAILALSGVLALVIIVRLWTRKS